MYTMPEPGPYRRKSDGRIDQVVSADGTRFIRMFSPATGKHWSIQVTGFNRKYEPMGTGS